MAEIDRRLVLLGLASASLTSGATGAQQGIVSTERAPAGRRPSWLHPKQILHRVLSFDGGGIRGLYQAKLLERLKASGFDVAKHADIIAGTSTGGIIAAGLALGKEPAAISALYSTVGKTVFPPRGLISRIYDDATWLAGHHSYSAEVLREALESELGKTTKLGDCKKRLIIPAISLNQYKLRLFDSKDDSDKDYRLVDVVLASAAAPTYFPPALVGDTHYVDGGLCCNNPTFRAVARLSSEDVDLSRMYVLSISSGVMPITKAGHEFQNLRNFGWARPTIDLAMSASSDLAVQDGAMVGYHFRVTETLGSQIDLDAYQAALDIIPPLAQGKADSIEVKTGVRRWIDGPRSTGLNFAGKWDTEYTWESDYGINNTGFETETLEAEQIGDFVVGQILAGKYYYIFSGTVQGTALIGEWRGESTLQGNFLLIKSKETGLVSGHWAGTSDMGTQFGKWSWKPRP
ncbi:patatin-like phospholipase family protein [Bradyrhizobium sp.]|jgi:predicted acylesterase/phospholipase RssA|uniref:patatin-like phospholipase family protein n=1 Tax=Bradyrhizobium sp. TaxID=376 RepID=UPI002DDD490A|nr:patatin-like phospholipase family protein [Bradyrhizobium sp.]HEV2159478.1 patatin-like phospholipase family protein [Bradyrhizobium sp.]